MCTSVEVKNMPALSSYNTTTKKFTQGALIINVIEDYDVGGIDKITDFTRSEISKQHAKLNIWLDGFRSFLSNVQFQTDQESNRMALLSDVDALKSVLAKAKFYTNNKFDGRLA